MLRCVRERKEPKKRSCVAREGSDAVDGASGRRRAARAGGPICMPTRTAHGRFSFGCKQPRRSQTVLLRLSRIISPPALAHCANEWVGRLRPANKAREKRAREPAPPATHTNSSSGEERPLLTAKAWRGAPLFQAPPMCEGASSCRCLVGAVACRVCRRGCFDCFVVQSKQGRRGFCVWWRGS